MSCVADPAVMNVDGAMLSAYQQVVGHVPMSWKLKFALEAAVRDGANTCYGRLDYEQDYVGLGGDARVAIGEIWGVPLFREDFMLSLPLEATLEARACEMAVRCKQRSA